METGEHGRPVRVSVVIPTFNRRDVVAASVLALEKQSVRGFEVIVVVDGSTDGTALRLRTLGVSFPLAVLEQENSGAAAARNRGAADARGDILLFLDDDMEADPRLLEEHERCHRSGSHIVIGHMPLHPESPEGILRRGVGEWAEERLARMTAPGGEPALEDLLTGQLSIQRSAFQVLGGFDVSFTSGGSFGNEDIDFGCRARKLDLRVAFNPRAVSWQRYVVRPDQFLRQRRDAGRADVLFARKHPERAADAFRANGAEQGLNRLVWRPVLGVPVVSRLVRATVRRAALALVGRGRSGYVSRRIFAAASSIEYWSGVRDAGGIPRAHPPRVLAYHAITEVPAGSPLAPYTVTPELFARQIDTLLRAGFRFIDADAVLDYVRHGRALPPRAVLLTFDDCYADLRDTALPLLRARRIPAVAFAVSGQIGGVNTWDRHLGAPEMQLLDADGLRTIAAAGVEIGAHSRTHRVLSHIASSELTSEIDGCSSELEALGLPRPRLFAYPYGEFDDRVEAALRANGMAAAFTVRPAPLARNMNPLLLPRIPIFANDVGDRFARTVSGASSIGNSRRGRRALWRDLRAAWADVGSSSEETLR